MKNFFATGLVMCVYAQNNSTKSILDFKGNFLWNKQKMGKQHSYL